MIIENMDKLKHKMCEEKSQTQCNASSNDV